MTYKIAHFADTHIRNLKYHDEYRVVFNKMYEYLQKSQTSINNKRKQITSVLHFAYIECQKRDDKMTFSGLC